MSLSIQQLSFALSPDRVVFQIVSIAGAMLILVAFAAQQFQRLDAETKTYQMLNLIGGFCLCAAAIDARLYGFILLEGSWTVISAWGLWRVVRTERPLSS